MSIYARHVNGKQRSWLARYEAATGFEPLGQEDLDRGVKSFNQVARENIRWFEEWSNEAMGAMSTQVPWTEETP